MEGVELAGDVVRADGLDVGPVHPASAGAIRQAHLADKKWLFQGVNNCQNQKKVTMVKKQKKWLWQ